MSEIMSYSLKYYPDPGIAFDISKMLFVKLNPESVWKDYMTTRDSRIDEVEFIRNNASFFPHPDPLLLLFSFRPSNKTETFISQVISKLVFNDFTDFSVKLLIKYLNNSSVIQQDLYTYYLGEQDFSFSNLEHSIRICKTIPDKIKLLLFGFSLNASRYISLLCEIIQKYYNIFEVSFIPKSKTITISSSFINDIINNTYSSKQLSDIHLHPKSISYSLSFSTPYYLFRNFHVQEPFIITTHFTIEHLFTKDTEPYESTLLTKITALNDKYRLSIIKHLVRNKNMTLQEISRSIGLSVSTTNHHLTQLKKANMLTITRQSHSMYYSFNPEGFQDTIKLLNKLEKGVSKS